MDHIWAGHGNAHARVGGVATYEQVAPVVRSSILVMGSAFACSFKPATLRRIEAVRENDDQKNSNSCDSISLLHSKCKYNVIVNISH